MVNLLIHLSFLQVFPVKIATCNLHGETTRAGITGMIDNISLKQYISTAPIRHDTSQPEVWIESGGISLGPIKAEAAIALTNQDFHALQNQFLTIHDIATKRLWFLWPVHMLGGTNMMIGKCGCMGGCCFFGNNKNGVEFFHSKKHHEVTPNAIFKVSPEGNDPGFGQSLLHKNRLVFDTASSSGFVSPGREFTFTRGYMSDIPTPDTPGTSITVIEECLNDRNNTLVESSREEIPVPGPSPPVSSPPVVSRSSTVETRSSSSYATSPTELMASDNTSMVSALSNNPFDTLRSTGTDTLRSTDSAELARSVSISSSSSPPPFSPTTRSSIAHSPSSRSSIHSPSGHSSIHSASPSSIRNKRVTGFTEGRHTSIVSLDSEMYFSAEEEAAQSSSSPVFPTLKQRSYVDMMGSTEGDSVAWADTSATTINTSDLSGKDVTVLERPLPSTSSSNSTLSYMSADTDPDETLSDAGLPAEDLSMVDLRNQVNIFRETEYFKITNIIKNTSFLSLVEHSIYQIVLKKKKRRECI